RLSFLEPVVRGRGPELAACRLLLERDPVTPALGRTRPTRAPDEHRGARPAPDSRRLRPLAAGSRATNDRDPESGGLAEGLSCRAERLSRLPSGLGEAVPQASRPGCARGPNDRLLPLGKWRVDHMAAKEERSAYASERRRSSSIARNASSTGARARSRGGAMPVC